MNRKVKGFTLIEMIVVIAIIAILAGISSMAMQGYVRDAKIESCNKKAQMVYTAFQDMLTDCEVYQDRSILDGHELCGTTDIIATNVFFRIASTDVDGNPYVSGNAIGDEIHIQSWHGDAGCYSPSEYLDENGNNTNTSECGASVYPAGSTVPGAITTDDSVAKWNKIGGYIKGRAGQLDGTYCVMLNVKDYQVVSVVGRDLDNGRDPKTGLWDSAECKGLAAPLSEAFNDYNHAFNNAVTYEGDAINFPHMVYMARSAEDQKKMVKRTGIYFGTYPFANQVYQDISW